MSIIPTGWCVERAGYVALGQNVYSSPFLRVLAGFEVVTVALTVSPLITTLRRFTSLKKPLKELPLRTPEKSL